MKTENQMQKNGIVLFLFVFMSLSCFPQKKELTWEDLNKQYEFPEWYTSARFGIWAHWGAQVQPKMGGGWYARHMYQPDVGNQQWGKEAYNYHVKTYGHPSEIGYKDVINEWKAENLDTDALVNYFKSIGAKFFMVLANHHDRFDNFDSTHFEWNSVNVGPKRDIVGEFEQSARKYDLPFGVSSHDDRFLNWWLPAFAADSSGPYEGIPYDGHMTKEDGKGKWWEGMDPSKLYGLPPEKRTPEWINQVKENWLLRTKELVTKYDVDLLWFDGYGFPYGEFGKEVCTAFFNYRLQKHGRIDAVIAGKIKNEPATVKDIERGGASEILPYPWQGITTIRTWFYKEDPHRMENKHSARTIIELLADYISKNGNLVLNVELLPDGTIPPDHKKILDDIGAWINLNNEAIYASKPWKIYGDNLDSYLKNAEKKGVDEADLKALDEHKKDEHFNERTVKSPAYGKDEVRFTIKDNDLYMFVLNPDKGNIAIPSLGLNSKQNPKRISTIQMIGSNEQINFSQQGDKLILMVPAKRPNKYAVVFKIKGVL